MRDHLSVRIEIMPYYCCALPPCCSSCAFLRCNGYSPRHATVWADERLCIASVMEFVVPCTGMPLCHHVEDVYSTSHPSDSAHMLHMICMCTTSRAAGIRGEPEYTNCVACEDDGPCCACSATAAVSNAQSLHPCAAVHVCECFQCA